MSVYMPTLAERVDPKRAALLLIDLQAHVEHQKNYIADIPRMIGRTKRLIERAKAAGVTCIYTRGVEKTETNTPVWISRHVTKPHRLGTRADGTPGAEYHPELRPAPSDIQFVKSRYSCFIDTPLERILAERKIDSLILCGIATNICVEITARDAFQRDLWTIVASDCCAARTEEEQTRSLSDIEKNWGIVLDSDEIIAEWARMGAGTTVPA